MKTQEDGIPWIWVTGGSLSFLLILMVALVGYVGAQGLWAFWPKPLYSVHSSSQNLTLVGQYVKHVPSASVPHNQEQVLLLQGNRDWNGQEFALVSVQDFSQAQPAHQVWFVERREWGPFMGSVAGLFRGSLPSVGTVFEPAEGNASQPTGEPPSPPEPLPLHTFQDELQKAKARRDAMDAFEKQSLIPMNRRIETLRLEQSYLERTQLLAAAHDSLRIESRLEENAKKLAQLMEAYQSVADTYKSLRQTDEGFYAVLEPLNKAEKKSILLSDIVRAYKPNELSFLQKTKIFVHRIYDFLTLEPREANTAGGILPALFGTAAMTLMMCLFVLPFGVLAAVYMREIAKQGFFVSLVRVAVGNLSGVPSIVFGVFGLGFFCYGMGSQIDQWFFVERLPSPTFGTGGILWASLTLALLTVPVVIVATEEALASVPRTLREASYGCGATRLQTLWHIVLPKAIPGIMTGLIMAIARGVGEVAPLLLTGVVKLAPELPIDGFFPFVHLERSFMHLAFHIYDLGFQSRSSEESRPMVFASTFVLITMVLVLNFAAIKIRSSLRRRFEGRGAF